MTSSRVQPIHEIPFDGKSVMYVMSRDQRIQDNHALLEAQSYALHHHVPLYVLFVLKEVNHRSREHYEFMLRGLEQVSTDLSKYAIPFILRIGDAETEIRKLCEEISCGALFFDFSPLTHSRELVSSIKAKNASSVYVVDTHNIIPVWHVSDKQEYAARTMRLKVHRQLEPFLKEPKRITKHPHAAQSVNSQSLNDAKDYLRNIPSCGIATTFFSGEKAALDHLNDFINDGLEMYASGRNNIAHDQQSNLSPYLHFGQLSSLRVALQVMNSVDALPLLYSEARMPSAGETPSRVDGMNALFEEMIVRKELSDNFCYYNNSYKSLEGAPDWAKRALKSHRDDPRDFTYSREQWENSETHDELWNASQNQLRKVGKIHGYMRMYWAKKLLEWSASPEEALEIGIYLNDTYSIDGGDPNGYVGLLWSIAGLHDRPWSNRPVYGSIRYMSANGLRRKFDTDSYVRQWNT